MTRMLPDESGKDGPNYLKEMLISQPSVLGTTGAIAAGALLSIPFGLGVGVIPVLGAMAAQSIAALFVPSSPSFRESVDQRKRRERRVRRTDHLIGELQSRAHHADSRWNTYNRMIERLDSLRKIAGNRGSGLATRQLEDLEDATVDFLALWLALLSMYEHQRSVDPAGIRRRIKDIDQRLETVSSAVDRKHLEKARGDFEGVLLRRESVRTRATSVEAAMLSMADAFEEVYHRIVANPSSEADVTSALDSAVEHFRVEEELDLAVDRELEDVLSKGRAAAAERSKA